MVNYELENNVEMRCNYAISLFAIIRNLDPQSTDLEVSWFPIYVMVSQVNNIVKYFVVCNHVCSDVFWVGIRACSSLNPSRDGKEYVRAKEDDSL